MLTTSRINHCIIPSSLSSTTPTTIADKTTTTTTTTTKDDIIIMMNDSHHLAGASTTSSSRNNKNGSDGTSLTYDRIAAKETLDWYEQQYNNTIIKRDEMKKDIEQHETGLAKLITEQRSLIATSNSSNVFKLIKNSSDNTTGNKSVIPTVMDIDNEIALLEKKRETNSMSLASEKAILKEIYKFKKVRTIVEEYYVYETKIQSIKERIGTMKQQHYTLIQTELIQLKIQYDNAKVAYELGCPITELVGIKVQCPTDKIGQVIGKKGKNIKQIESIAKVDVNIVSTTTETPTGTGTPTVGTGTGTTTTAKGTTTTTSNKNGVAVPVPASMKGNNNGSSTNNEKKNKDDTTSTNTTGTNKEFHIIGTKESLEKAKMNFNQMIQQVEVMVPVSEKFMIYLSTKHITALHTIRNTDLTTQCIVQRTSTNTNNTNNTNKQESIVLRGQPNNVECMKQQLLSLQSVVKMELIPNLNSRDVSLYIVGKDGCIINQLVVQYQVVIDVTKTVSNNNDDNDTNDNNDKNDVIVDTTTTTTSGHHNTTNKKATTTTSTTTTTDITLIGESCNVDSLYQWIVRILETNREVVTIYSTSSSNDTTTTTTMMDPYVKQALLVNNGNGIQTLQKHINEIVNQHKTNSAATTASTSNNTTNNTNKYNVYLSFNEQDQLTFKCKKEIIGTVHTLIQKEIQRIQSIIIKITIDPIVIPILVGKNGDGMKQLKQSGLGNNNNNNNNVVIHIDRTIHQIIVASTNETSIQHVVSNIKECLQNNQVERISLLSLLLLQSTSSSSSIADDDDSKTTTKEEYLQLFREFMSMKGNQLRSIPVFVLSDDTTYENIIVRGTPTNINKAKQMITEYIDNSYTQMIHNVTNDEMKALCMGGKTKAKIVELEQLHSVKLHTKREENTILVKGKYDNVQRAIQSIHTFLHGGIMPLSMSTTTATSSSSTKTEPQQLEQVQQQEIIMVVTIPFHKDVFGLIIGRDGKNKKELEQTYPTVSIVTSSQRTGSNTTSNNNNNNALTLRGPKYDVIQCINTIQTILVTSRMTRTYIIPTSAAAVATTTTAKQQQQQQQEQQQAPVQQGSKNNNNNNKGRKSGSSGRRSAGNGNQPQKTSVVQPTTTTTTSTGTASSSSSSSALEHDEMKLKQLLNKELIQVQIECFTYVSQPHIVVRGTIDHINRAMTIFKEYYEKHGNTYECIIPVSLLIGCGTTTTKQNLFRTMIPNEIHVDDDNNGNGCCSVAFDDINQCIIMKGTKREHVKQAKLKFITLLETILGNDQFVCIPIKEFDNKLVSLSTLLKVSNDISKELYHSRVFIDHDIQSVLVYINQQQHHHTTTNDSVLTRENIKQFIAMKCQSTHEQIQRNKATLIHEYNFTKTNEEWIVTSLIAKRGYQIKQIRKECGSKCIITVDSKHHIVTIQGKDVSSKQRSTMIFNQYLDTVRTNSVLVPFPSNSDINAFFRTGTNAKEYSTLYNVELVKEVVPVVVQQQQQQEEEVATTTTTTTTSSSVGIRIFGNDDKEQINRAKNALEQWLAERKQQQQQQQQQDGVPDTTVAVVKKEDTNAKDSEEEEEEKNETTKVVEVVEIATSSDDDIDNDAVEVKPTTKVDDDGVVDEVEEDEVPATTVACLPLVEPDDAVRPDDPDEGEVVAEFVETERAEPQAKEVVADDNNTELLINIETSAVEQDNAQTEPEEIVEADNTEQPMSIALVSCADVLDEAKLEPEEVVEEVAEDDNNNEVPISIETSADTVEEVQTNPEEVVKVVANDDNTEPPTNIESVAQTESEDVVEVVAQDDNTELPISIIEPVVDMQVAESQEVVEVAAMDENIEAPMSIESAADKQDEEAASQPEEVVAIDEQDDNNTEAPISMESVVEMPNEESEPGPEEVNVAVVAKHENNTEATIGTESIADEQDEAKPEPEEVVAKDGNTEAPMSTSTVADNQDEAEPEPVDIACHHIDTTMSVVGTSLNGEDDALLVDTNATPSLGQEEEDSNNRDMAVVQDDNQEEDGDDDCLSPSGSSANSTPTTCNDDGPSWESVVKTNSLAAATTSTQSSNDDDDDDVDEHDENANNDNLNDIDLDQHDGKDNNTENHVIIIMNEDEQQQQTETFDNSDSQDEPNIKYLGDVVDLTETED